MSEFRHELESQRSAYRKLAYPGDLAEQVDQRRARRLRMTLALAGGLVGAPLAAAAVIALAAGVWMAARSGAAGGGVTPSVGRLAAAVMEQVSAVADPSVVEHSTPQVPEPPVGASPLAPSWSIDLSQVPGPSNVDFSTDGPAESPGSGSLQKTEETRS